MGNSEPPRLPEGLYLELKEQIDGNCDEVLPLNTPTEPINCYLTENGGNKLLIAIFSDRIEAIGVSSRRHDSYSPKRLLPAANVVPQAGTELPAIAVAPQAVTIPLFITASALYHRHENPFLLVAVSESSIPSETSSLCFLLKFELTPLFILDSIHILRAASLFELPLTFPIKALVLQMECYDENVLLVKHTIGCSLLIFSPTYESYIVKDYFPYKTISTAWYKDIKTVVISAEEGLIMCVSEEDLQINPQENANKQTYTQENANKVVCSMAVYEQLSLLFLLAYDNSLLCYYIQVWDVKNRVLLTEKALVSPFLLHKLTKLLLKPCIKLAGIITIIVFSESEFAYLFAYSPMPISLSIVSKLRLSLQSPFLVTNYLNDGDIYLLRPSTLYLLPKAAFLPHLKHPFWTAPVIGCFSDLELRNEVEQLRSRMSERSLGLKDTLETMIRMRPGSAAMSRAETAFSRETGE